METLLHVDLQFNSQVPLLDESKLHILDPSIWEDFDPSLACPQSWNATTSINYHWPFNHFPHSRNYVLLRAWLSMPQWVFELRG